MNIERLKDLALFSLDDDVDEAGGLFPPSRYYAFFRRLAMDLKPKVSVVLGVCGGGDCHHLCLGNPDGRVHGIDISNDWPKQTEYLDKIHKNFMFWGGCDSINCIGTMKSLGLCSVNLLFIDTSHVASRALAEFEAWKPLLAPGAIVVFDDLLKTEMSGVWESLPEPKVRLDLLHPGNPEVGGGFGVLIYNEAYKATGYADEVKAPDYELGC